MSNGSPSPWQPTEADLIRARSVYASDGSDKAAIRALSGVEALVVAWENGDALTISKVIRSMRAALAVDAEGQAAPVKALPVEGILAELGAKIDESVDRFEPVRAEAA